MKANYKLKNNNGLKKHNEAYGTTDKAKLKNKDTFIVILFIVAFGAVSLLDILFEAKNNDVCLIFNIIEKVIWLGGFCYFGFFSETKPEIIGKIISGVFAVIPIFSLFTNYKIILFAGIICVISGAVYAAYAYYKHQKTSTSLKGVVLIGSIILITNINDFTFIEAMSDKFIILSLITAALITVITIIMLVKKLVPETMADEFSEKVALILMVLVLSFVLVYSSLISFNYIFDFKEPESMSIVIEAKDIEHGFRTPLQFVFSTSFDGNEFKFCVDSDTYKCYEIGDNYCIFKSCGAFGEEYYYSGIK